MTKLKSYRDSFERVAELDATEHRRESQSKAMAGNGDTRMAFAGSNPAALSSLDCGPIQTGQVAKP